MTKKGDEYRGICILSFQRHAKGNRRGKGGFSPKTTVHIPSPKFVGFRATTVTRDWGLFTYSFETLYRRFFHQYLTPKKPIAATVKAVVVQNMYLQLGHNTSKGAAEAIFHVNKIPRRSICACCAGKKRQRNREWWTRSNPLSIACRLQVTVDQFSLHACSHFSPQVLDGIFPLSCFFLCRKGP